MLKLKGKKIFTIYAEHFCLSEPVVLTFSYSRPCPSDSQAVTLLESTKGTDLLQNWRVKHFQPS